MSTYKFLLLLGFYFTTSIVNGQNNKAGPRDSSMKTTASALHNDTSLQNANGSSEQFIQGVVLESNKDGTFNPLAGASVMWSGTTAGVFTDSTGVFRIRRDVSTARLVVSYSGYRSDTLSVTDIRELKIILATGKQLREVVITSKQRSTYLSAINPVRTQIMTERELYKAACCNLSESFETNPSVDVTYNDAVTGSKQIHTASL